jgi:hypothetical protein
LPEGHGKWWFFSVVILLLLGIPLLFNFCINEKIEKKFLQDIKKELIIDLPKGKIKISTDRLVKVS